MSKVVHIGTLATLGVCVPGVDIPKFLEPPEPLEPTEADRKHIKAAQAKQQRKALRRLDLAKATKGGGP